MKVYTDSFIYLSALIVYLNQLGLVVSIVKLQMKKKRTSIYHHFINIFNDCFSV